MLQSVNVEGRTWFSVLFADSLLFSLNITSALMSEKDFSLLKLVSSNEISMMIAILVDVATLK